MWLESERNQWLSANILRGQTAQSVVPVIFTFTYMCIDVSHVSRGRVEIVCSVHGVVSQVHVHNERCTRTHHQRRHALINDIVCAYIRPSSQCQNAIFPYCVINVNSINDRIDVSLSHCSAVHARQVCVERKPVYAVRTPAWTESITLCAGEWVSRSAMP